MGSGLNKCKPRRLWRGELAGPQIRIGRQGFQKRIEERKQKSELNFPEKPGGAGKRTGRLCGKRALTEDFFHPE